MGRMEEKAAANVVRQMEQGLQDAQSGSHPATNPTNKPSGRGGVSSPRVNPRNNDIRSGS